MSIFVIALSSGWCK